MNRRIYESEGSGSTEMLQEQIEKCRTIAEFKKLYEVKLRNRKHMWGKAFTHLLEESKVSVTKLAEFCGVTRQSVYNWRDGSLPRSREVYIRLGIFMGCSLDEVNRLLTVYGAYPELYSRDPRDCVGIFVLQNSEKEKRCSDYLSLLERVEQLINMMPEPKGDIKTVDADKQISELREKDDFEKFITEHSETFSQPYKRFKASVDVWLSDYIRTEDDGFAKGVDELARWQKWPRKLLEGVKKMQKGELSVLDRELVLLLGIHLSQDRSEIDALLELAHMRRLYARNNLEGVIIFMLESAEDMEVRQDEDGFELDEHTGWLGYVNRVVSELGDEEISEFFAR